MRNFWLVLKHEYGRMVLRRAFILLTLAIPFGMAALIALAIAVELSGENKAPVGYVDHADILEIDRYATLPDYEERIGLQPFADEEAALAALNREEVQAIFVLPSDYPQGLATELYYLEESPDGGVWRDFQAFLRVNLLAQYPDEVASRLLEGANIEVHDVVSGRDFSEAAIIDVILPFVASLLFFVATMSAAGYMLQIVTDEKENRTMEIMLTSVSPEQLIAGKMVGLLLAALTQLGIYVATAVIGLIIAAPFVPELQQIAIPWAYIGVMAAFFLPAYLLVAAVMVAVGSAVTELQQGQQVAGIMNIFFMIPLFLLATIFENPSAPILIFFTYFPTTSFLTISLRWGVGTVPLWQLGVSWLILVTTAVLMVWVAVRIFRVGMLRYGQPLNWKSIVAVLTGKSLTSNIEGGSLHA